MYAILAANVTGGEELNHHSRVCRNLMRGKLEI